MSLSQTQIRNPKNLKKLSDFSISASEDFSIKSKRIHRWRRIRRELMPNHNQKGKFRQGRIVRQIFSKGRKVGSTRSDLLDSTKSLRRDYYTSNHRSLFWNCYGLANFLKSNLNVRNLLIISLVETWKPHDIFINIQDHLKDFYILSSPADRDNSRVRFRGGLALLMSKCFKEALTIEKTEK